MSVAASSNSPSVRVERSAIFVLGERLAVRALRAEGFRSWVQAPGASFWRPFVIGVFWICDSFYPSRRPRTAPLLEALC